MGLLGCGVVGGATARMLLENADVVAEKAGAPVKLARVAVKDLSRPRSLELPAHLMTDVVSDVAESGDIDIVVETIGGVDVARHAVMAALSSGKHVVTANKELLAAHGEEIWDCAHACGVDVFLEASVGGGIPVIRPLKESLAGDRVHRVMGILNGTTNYILTRMSETGETFGEALDQASRHGYTELDPAADIEGFDAASKLAILASLAFRTHVLAADVEREGIARIKPSDIAAAHDMGYEIKLLAVAEQEEGQILAQVHPAMVPRSHPLAAVRDVYNAVFVEAEGAGELMFFGRGAGGDPTASAIVGDIVEAARNVVTGRAFIASRRLPKRARMRPHDEARVRYYVVLSVVDRPGVLAAVAGAFAKEHISIASVRQEGLGDAATLALITHTATEGQHRRCFALLEHLDEVQSVSSTIRVEGTGES